MIETVLKDKERFVTAGVLLIAVGLILYSQSFFVLWLFLGAAYLLAFHEMLRLLGIEMYQHYLFALLLWLGAGFYPSPVELFFIALIGYGGYVAYYRVEEPKNLLPYIYPTLSFLMFLQLYSEFGTEAIIWLLVTVAATDVGAYFGGKSFGKKQFCQTSPNKTWEGVVIGVIAGTALGTLAGSLVISIGVAALISVVTSFASVFGDLFESHLKRSADVKDSGSIFPGHGGVLDRADGYMFGVVILYIMLVGFSF